MDLVGGLARPPPAPYAAATMHLRHMSSASLLRRLVKLAAIGAVAGGVGLAVGLGISRLSGSTIASTPAAPPATTAAPAAGATTAGPAAPATPPTAAAPSPRTVPPPHVTVRVLSAVLHPAATTAGRQRQRGRLIVRVVARNQGAQRVTPTRPALIAAGLATHTNPQADAPGTRLAPLAPGTAETVALQFEVAGAVTAQLTGQRAARIFIIGRAVPITVVIGSPVAPTGAPGP